MPMQGIKGLSNVIIKNTLPNNRLNDKFDDFCRDQTLKLGFGERYRHCFSNTPDDMIHDYLMRNTHETGTGIRLTGPEGSGKTWSLAIIAFNLFKLAGVYGIKGSPEMIDYWNSPLKGDIAYLYPERISADLCESTGSRLVENIKLYTKAKFLFIDDIDQIENNHHLPYRLSNIISRRYANNLTTFFTSTCAIDNMQANSNYNSTIRLLLEMTLPVNLEASTPQTEFNLQ